MKPTKRDWHTFSIVALLSATQIAKFSYQQYFQKDQLIIRMHTVIQEKLWLYRYRWEWSCMLKYVTNQKTSPLDCPLSWTVLKTTEVEKKSISN